MFVIGFVIGWPQKRIYSILKALLIVNLKVVIKKFLSSADLPTTKALNVYKFQKIIMVSQNKNFMTAAFDRMTLILEGLDNSRQFYIVVFIILFKQNSLLRIKSHRMPVLFFVFLKKCPTNDIAQIISFHPYVLLYIKISKNKSNQKRLFWHLKRFFCFQKVKIV